MEMVIHQINHQGNILYILTCTQKEAHIVNFHTTQLTILRFPLDSSYKCTKRPFVQISVQNSIFWILNNIKKKQIGKCYI